ncbi:glycosyltransferase, group 2 family protein [Bacillus sp. JCM 19047]|nr:glycosyltransferase, group 2 family protein [Bacillus sp. JCM 19047]
MQYFQRKNQNRVKKEHPLQKQPVQRNHAYRLAVIVPAMNEEDTLGAVLDEINRLMPDELIVVVNGSKDQTAAVASEKGAKVIQFHYPLGNDVGRAIGAEAANADIYLFTDADIVIQAEQYIPFIVAIENGEDLSLNSIDWITHFDKADTISAGRYFLNHIQGRKDLRAENLLTIPHTMSHHLIQVIGVSALVNPMLANSMALQKTKNVTVPFTIDVLKMNKPRKNHVAKGSGQLSTAMQRMQGDMLEALHYVIHHGNRDLVEIQVVWDEQELEQCREAWCKDQPKKPVSFVVYIDDHYDTSLVTTIAQLQHNETVEVIPVVSGECSVLCWQLEQMKQPYLRLQQIEKMGPAFKVGQRFSRGDYCLFHHGCIPLTVYHIAQFVEQA